MKEFITFGANHLDRDGLSLGDAYCIIEGEDTIAIRKRVMALRGVKFCTTYPIGDLERQCGEYSMYGVCPEQVDIMTVQEK